MGSSGEYSNLEDEGSSGPHRSTLLWIRPLRLFSPRQAPGGVQERRPMEISRAIVVCSPKMIVTSVLIQVQYKVTPYCIEEEGWSNLKVSSRGQDLDPVNRLPPRIRGSLDSPLCCHCACGANIPFPESNYYRSEKEESGTSPKILLGRCRQRLICRLQNPQWIHGIELAAEVIPGQGR